VPSPVPFTSELIIDRPIGGEGAILRTPYKHRAILLFFYEFQSGGIVLPSKLANSTLLFFNAKW
jgi:hypothetical protein